MRHLFAAAVLMLGGTILVSAASGCSLLSRETPPGLITASPSFSDSPIPAGGDTTTPGPMTATSAFPDSPVPIAEDTEPPGPASPSSGPLRGTLTFSEPPILNKPVEITARFLARADVLSGEGKLLIRDVKAEISLPEGFELVRKPDDVQLDNNARVFNHKAGIYEVGRALKWQGDLVVGVPLEIRATIRAIGTGDFDMEARAVWIPQPGGSAIWVGSQVLYISVFKDRAEVRTTRPSKPLPSWSEPPSKVR